MTNGNIKIIPFIILIGLILLSITAEKIYLGDFEYRYRTRRFNRILNEKEKIMTECLKGMEPILARGEKHGSELENDLFSVAMRNNITILEYIENKLAYWSDTEFDVPRVLTDSLHNKPFIFLQNGWFLSSSVKAGNEVIIGLMRIRRDYGFENEIIKNGFLKDFRIPENTKYSRDPGASEFKLFKSDGTYLFSLLYPSVKTKTSLIFLPLILWSVTFALIICICVYITRLLILNNKRSFAFLLLSLIFSSIYLLVLVLKKPVVLFQTELFSPYRYTMNALIPSLGHLLVFSILLSVLAYLLFMNLKKDWKITTAMRPGYLFLTLLLIPGALLFAIYHLVFIHLIFNSNISFETFKILDLNIFSLAGFVSLILLFGIPFLYLYTIFHLLKLPGFKTFILSLLTVLPVFPLFFYKDPQNAIPVILLFVLISLFVWQLSKSNSGLFNKTVEFSVIFGIYSLYLITCFSERKTEDNVKIQLVSYSTENDPMAEHLLLDMWPVITSDSALRRMMNVEVFEQDDFDEISSYLHNKYFHGYWRNFNINIVLCTQNDSLSVGDRNLYFTDCFYFFGRKILVSGQQLTGTGFYFIDSKQGRSSYLGRLYFSYQGSRINGLFIDLYSDINVFQPGYSELLLDRKYHSYARLRDYSFAKYINGDIVFRTGDFPYNKSDAGYIENVSDYRSFRADSFKHTLYRNGNVTVIISRPVVSVQDIIISFAYLFAFIFIFSNLILLIFRKIAITPLSGLNFRQKMQLSFTSILLFSFTLIGFVIASIAVKQYQSRHYDNIKEKLNSVYTELEDKLSTEKVLNSSWRSSTNTTLEEMLVRLSNIFNTDINLFDLKGYLIATSRPEIYNRNLISERMDNMASFNLENLKKSEYFHNEKIGNLEYVSAYVPFYNADNDLIAFLNLPYFRMQSVLTKEISNMIVTVINFTLLLIVIAMSLAVFISGRLTSPLAVLSSRLATVELGKKSEHLSYKGNDEVGELVRQYNRMVDELDESAQKLANSEREYAWREMAKQIAHEIKNPLTPMKLNIQQLFKSWTDGTRGFEKKLERFTKNQIDYIDNLSSIASAFSSFAKIPEANPSQVDVMEQIKTTLELFKSSDRITFRIGWTPSQKIYIYADKEQINSIFSNLIKNSIQSIPQGQDGVIRVNLETGSDKVKVSIADNGIGIPESLQKKMFTPNFTTKSSGTGLGLSIVKRYVENAGGRIWFESQPGKGSVFFTEFPLLKTEGDQDER